MLDRRNEDPLATGTEQGKVVRLCPAADEDTPLGSMSPSRPATASRARSMI